MTQGLIERARAALTQGLLPTAVDAAQAAIAENPLDPDAWELAGLAHFRLADYGRAAECFRRVTDLAPERATAWSNCAAALNHTGAVREAIVAGRRAVALAPGIEALNNLGAALDHDGQAAQAAECYRQALAIAPSGVLWNNLGNALKGAGDLQGAIAAYRRAAELDPALLRAQSNLMLVLNYSGDVSPAETLGVARRVGEALLHGRAPFPARSAAGGPLVRVGFVGADFYNHPVGRLILPVLEARTRGRTHWTLYAQNTVRDRYSERLRAAADAWVDIAALNDDALGDRVASDGIDVLVDLSGHTAGNRLPVFARRAAPVQLSWLGYAGTTGVSAIDGVIVDHDVVPPGAEAFFSEPVLHLNRPYVAYGAPESEVPCGDPPCLRNGYVTFGAFNNPAKTTPAVIALWSRLLQRLPGARILFKSRCYGDATHCEALRAQFARHGIDAERLVFEGISFGADYFASFNRVDIALDPFPFNGLMTTLDTVWMGVPVVTRAAAIGMLGRHGLLVAHAVRAPEWVASTDEAYLDAATRLAHDPSTLIMWRCCLRDALKRSALCDASGLAGALERVFLSLVEAKR
ncbi:tetratricopeptide repeat protein [Niveibacterium umoris]|uniref:protein O-GlcNAc transferase n=1 Tax=Niveibacterium umoris TaxID=1193620 RepID=A0A840BSE2_9RHOO|nr:tetratricopeptide repeat protein [Niveibacterium umoris]MBB4014592.1 putative O-linked N-acetylglucosamine transferase (SPINDLY family) [Niveibacterium umoris]